MFDKEMFKETFSELHASEDTLTEVLKMTAKKKKHFKVLRVFPVAAALILLLSVTAFAVVGFTVYENPSAMLRAFFGENGAAASDGIVEYDEDGKLAVNLPGWERVPVDETLADDLIANYISAETAVISWEGYTLMVEANLYDPLTESGLLYYTVENPDGVDRYRVEVNGMFGWYVEAGNIFTRIDVPGERYIDEAMSTETKVYICEYYINWNLSDNPLELEISAGVEVADPDGPAPYVEHVVHGTAGISLESSGEMSSLTLADGNVLVSPIGIRIYEEALGFDRASYIHNITLRYNDGSEYVLLDNEGFIDNRMYALGQGTSGPYHTTHLFNRIVDIGSLAEIILDDVVIDVN